MSSDLKSVSDEDVVRLFKDGDESAFDELYCRYSERLKRLIFYYVGDSDEADDVFHDVFLRVFKHVGSYRDDKPFSSWIYQIAVNCSKNHRKKIIKKDILHPGDIIANYERRKGNDFGLLGKVVKAK